MHTNLPSPPLPTAQDIYPLMFYAEGGAMWADSLPDAASLRRHSVGVDAHLDAIAEHQVAHGVSFRSTHANTSHTRSHGPLYMLAQLLCRIPARFLTRRLPPLPPPSLELGATDRRGARGGGRRPPTWRRQAERLGAWSRCSLHPFLPLLVASPPVDACARDVSGGRLCHEGPPPGVAGLAPVSALQADHARGRRP